MLHSIPQASGQCCGLGYGRLAHRSLVSLPWASLVGNSLVWAFLLLNGWRYPAICVGIWGFFSGLVCSVCCPCFYGLLQGSIGNVFGVCTILTHQVSRSTVAHIFSHSHLCLQCFKEYSKISWHRRSEAVCKIPSCGTTKATFSTHITYDFY